MAQYDYIIAGAGCSGLSLLMRMISSGEFSNKKILLVDKATKRANDRTWCFWEKQNGFFQEIVYKEWEKLRIKTGQWSSLKNSSPYRYKMIRGIDFYEHCFSRIGGEKNIEIIYGNIENLHSDNDGPYIVIDGKKITGQYIFNSIIFETPVLKKDQFYLLQHFKGWIIETGKEIFNSNEATLMDFSITQKNGNAFAYILPFSTNKALIEYTLFTETVLEKKEYDNVLQNYIGTCFPGVNYKITEEESGIIPMTNFLFEKSRNNIIHIGTAGGQTKSSSGYTFQFIQKQSREIVEQLIRTGNPFTPKNKKRFRFYDSVLLNVLATKKLTAENVFEHLFRKNDIKAVFDFLDNESNLLQEIKIISTLPVLPFLRAGIKELF